MLICNNNDSCKTIDLPSGELIAKFPLGSYNSRSLSEADRADGTSAGSRANHSNQIMFGAVKFKESDPFPLLYVTTGNSGDHD